MSRFQFGDYVVVDGVDFKVVNCILSSDWIDIPQKWTKDIRYWITSEHETAVVPVVQCVPRWGPAEILQFREEDVDEVRLKSPSVQKKGKWISVADETPDFGQRVFVRLVDDFGVVHSQVAGFTPLLGFCLEDSGIAIKDPDGGLEDQPIELNLDGQVTHWLPIPQGV